jgi:hypothetical protein
VRARSRAAQAGTVHRRRWAEAHRPLHVAGARRSGQVTPSSSACHTAPDCMLRHRPYTHRGRELRPTLSFWYSLSRSRAPSWSSRILRRSSSRSRSSSTPWSAAFTTRVGGGRAPASLLLTNAISLLAVCARVSAVRDKVEKETLDLRGRRYPVVFATGRSCRSHYGGRRSGMPWQYCDRLVGGISRDED